MSQPGVQIVSFQVHLVDVPQVRGELATVLATSVLSILATLFAVRWIGAPLLVKHPCAATTFPEPGRRHETADSPAAGSDIRARAQWLAQVRENPCSSL